MAQVLAASVVFGGLLFYAGQYWDWTAMQDQAWMRVGLLAGVLSACGVVYFATLRGLGMDLRALWRR
jgi:putative peptidoglycan lipid II flippase